MSEVVDQRGRDVAPAGIEQFDARERVDPDHWLEQPWLGAVGKAHVAVDECRLVVALGEDHDVAEVHIVGRDIEPAASRHEAVGLPAQPVLASGEATEGEASAEIGHLAAARGTRPGILDVDVDAWDIDGAHLRSFALLGDGGGDVARDDNARCAWRNGAQAREQVFKLPDQDSVARAEHARIGLRERSRAWHQCDDGDRRS